MEEVWIPLDEFDGLYVVSNFGRVKSYKIEKNNGRLLNPYQTKSGKLRVELIFKRKRYVYFVHDLVAEIFLSKKYNPAYVQAIDGDYTNCHVTNLEWCTSS